MSSLSRRDFLKRSTYASALTGGALHTFTQMRLLNSAAAQGTSAFTDYKAIVCVMLEGGNDAFNTIHAYGNNTPGSIREEYEEARGSLALLNDGTEDGNPLNPVGTPSDAFQRFYNGTVSPLAAHYGSPGLARLFNDGDMSIIFNVGTLVEPLANRAAYRDSFTAKPAQLFSHNDQRQQWQTSLSNEISLSSGWGGRLAELINPGNPATAEVSMSIGINRTNAFQVGPSTEVLQYVVNDSGPASLVSFNSGSDPYGGASNSGSTFNSPSYRATDDGFRLSGFEDLIRASDKSLFNDEQAKIITRARVNEAVIIEANSVANDDIDAVFAGIPDDNGLRDQLSQVAKLIAGRDIIGNKRQIFYVQIGGYDTHTASLPLHNSRLGYFSEAMEAFKNALKLPSVNAWDETMTFTASDFGRSASANGSDRDAVGSDHAWAGHAFVMGGAVKGGQYFGDYPSIRRTSDPNGMDVGRGRLIPTVSVEQYSCVIADWFGADSNALDTIFPNLYRFDNPLDPSSSTNLDFIA